MYRRKIFVSFDFEEDRNYKYTLNMWSSRTDFDFTMDDRSPREIQTDSVSVVKQVLSRKINEASTIIVIAGEQINKPHKDRYEIGYINWQNYEVAKAIELRKDIILVKLHPSSQCPEQLYGHYYVVAKNFTQEDILDALRTANK